MATVADIIRDLDRRVKLLEAWRLDVIERLEGIDLLDIDLSQDLDIDVAPDGTISGQVTAKPEGVDPDDFVPDLRSETAALNDGQIGGGPLINLPDPSPEAKAQWDATADAIMEHIDVPKWGMSVEDAAAAYRKAGPLWLASGSDDVREHLMSLPPTMRAAMVQSVESYAPNDAKLLARDILRQDTEASQQASYDQGLKRADDRLAGYVPQANL